MYNNNQKSPQLTSRRKNKHFLKKRQQNKTKHLLSPQNSRLHLLSQFSIFANILQKNLNDPAFIESTPALLTVSQTTVQASCVLKTLLQPALTNDAIRTYMNQDVTLPEVSLSGEVGAVKRAYIMSVVKLMNNVFSRVKVIGYTSVILADSS